MRTRRWIYMALACLVGLGAWLGLRLTASLPQLEGRVILSGLEAPASAESDRLAIPDVNAANRADAFRILGYLHARDRFFQMELMRRKIAGRLAELFGERAVPLDTQQRSYRFEAAARAIVQALPPEQRQVLRAYVAGVNAFSRHGEATPPEMLALQIHPEPWREEDSMLVALGMFQTLSSEEKDERMLSVMEKALPAALVAFLTPDVDDYAVPLLGGTQSRRPAQPMPVAALAELTPSRSIVAGMVDSESIIAGSNNWVVSGSKTHDGRAILANDMHLSLGVPNIWYRAALRYAGRTMAGLTLPGVPLLVAGSNGDLAWGYTNIDADVVDLVRLELNPANADEYRTPAGWRAFEHHRETIRVKGGHDIPLELRSTVWGPVSPTPLFGAPVAVRWVALDAHGVDLGLLDMDEARSLTEGMDVLNRSGGPHQNVLLADSQGHIAWTFLGRFPDRHGLDGAVSRSWADGTVGWKGFIAAAELPRVIDPPEGFLATANNRTLGRDYPHVIGHNFAHGYRAYRIAERLRQMDKISEQDLLDLQLDTRSAFFDYWQELALNALDAESRLDPLLAEVAGYVEAWDGRMDAGSRGIGLLVLFRQRLAEAVFAPVVQRCRQEDPRFSYAWREMETPLRAMLDRQDPATLPDRKHGDWPTLIRDVLRASASELKQLHQTESLARLSWGAINRVALRHPVSAAVPALSWLLDMPQADSGGCSMSCVRILGNGHGASERMVISPAHPDQGLLHMPGGQSGHPLSAHYRDQQQAWHDGDPLPFLAGAALYRLEFVPETRSTR
ncbi:MAG: penicillin acylase [Proteobacteria bacterium]|nr:penicillin acylase [Pseudomonadota bacterium]